MTTSLLLVLAIAAQFTSGAFARGTAEAAARMRGERPVDPAAVLGLSGPPLFVMSQDSLETQRFLGCLNCPASDPQSVHNPRGPHGPASFKSVVNQAARHSHYGACNPTAPHPPVIVDASGAYYGELTVNQARPNRIAHAGVRAWLADACQR